MPKRVSVDNVEPDVEPAASKVLPNATSQPIVTQPKFGLDDDLKKSNKALSSFIAFPEKVLFEGKEDDEHVILFLRAHPITNIGWILVTALLGLVPVFIFPLLFKLNALPALPSGFMVVFTLGWYLATFTYGFLKFLMWFYNVGIVTDERIVDIDWSSLLTREVTMSLISKIQDVSPSQNGIFAGFFDYGTVNIQTAGENQKIEFSMIPHPLLVARKIQNLMHQEELEWEVKPND